MKLFTVVLGASFVFFIVMFMRCEKITEITELVKNTEKIQIVIYNDTLPETVIEITDKNEIKKFDDYFSNADTPLHKCSYQGQIVFIMNDDVASDNNNSVTMEYNLQPDCMHVAYMYAGALHTKELTEEGVEYLRVLREEQ